MSLKQALIDEIEREAVSTGKMLERIPEDKFDWSPHARSMAMKALAVHIVGIAAYTDVIATTDYLDIGKEGRHNQKLTRLRILSTHLNQLPKNH